MIRGLPLRLNKAPKEGVTVAEDVPQVHGRPDVTLTSLRAVSTFIIVVVVVQLTDAQLL